MRTIALLLILANVGVYFWAHYVDVPEARLTSSDAVTPTDRAPPLLLAREHVTPSSEVTAKINSELSCISVGPFDSVEQAQTLAQRLLTAEFTTSPRAETGEVFAGYWVSLQNFASKVEAEQVLTRLQASGITDAYILTEEEPPNVLSLGLFSERARAEQRRADIAKLGYQPLIQNRTRMGATHWLDVNLQEPGQALDPALLQSDTVGIVRLQTKPCSELMAVQQHSSAATTP
jgi:hypothetical protein